jgi:cytochrome c oxidase subunit 2
LSFLVLGCAWLFPETPMTTVHPESDSTDMIQHVYKIVTYWVVAIFIVVEVVLLYAVIRFRQKPGEEGIPEQVHGNTPIEVGWTLLPVVIVVFLAFPTLRTTCALQQPAAPGALKVHVMGKQWWWAIEYPDLGVVTANEIHIHVGQMADVQLTSDNVIHSFWVPRLSGKRDLVPGRGQHIWFTPKEVGWYEGQCAELCGASHALMAVRVKVDSPEEFQAWVDNQKKIVSMADPGMQTFMRAGCIACHAINGTPFQQKLGPNLTHVGSRTMIAGETLQNTPENLAKWIKDPSGVKPGALMPNLNVTDEQLKTLVAYLQSLK